MNKKLTKLLIFPFVLIPFLLTSSSYIIAADKKPFKQKGPKPSVEGWIPMNSKTNETLRDIWGSSINNVHAVGDKGTIRHYMDNEKLLWSKKKNPTKEKFMLNGVWGNSQEGDINAYAVGNGGSIIRYVRNKSEWSEMKNPAKEKKINLNGIWGSFQKGIINAYAVGNGGTILSYDMKKDEWSEMENPAKKDGINLNDIWGSFQKGIINAYAVGNGGTILSYDMKKDEWFEMDNPAEKDGINLNSIWGSFKNGEISVYAVGNKGIILEYDNVQGTWSKIGNPTKDSLNLNDIYGRSADDIFAVGNKGTVIHYDGTGWSSETISRPNPDLNLYGVWVSQNPHVFVVGQNGTISYTYSAIKGKICDSCTGNGIQYAGVWRRNRTTGIWDNMGETYNQAGDFNCVQSQWALSGTEDFEFRHSSYFTESTRIAIAPGYIFIIYNYLLPRQGYQNCISGVVSREIQRGTPPETYHEALPNISVKLYRQDECGCYTLPPLTTTTNQGGHYQFDGLDGGAYKVEVIPVEDYDPEINNIGIAIPRSTQDSYDFIKN